MVLHLVIPLCDCYAKNVEFIMLIRLFIILKGMVKQKLLISLFRILSRMVYEEPTRWA